LLVRELHVISALAISPTWTHDLPNTCGSCLDDRSCLLYIAHMCLAMRLDAEDVGTREEFARYERYSHQDLINNKWWV
jgi:hypothetical protein